MPSGILTWVVCVCVCVYLYWGTPTMVAVLLGEKSTEQNDTLIKSRHSFHPGFGAAQKPRLLSVAALEIKEPNAAVGRGAVLGSAARGPSISPCGTFKSGNSNSSH